MCGTERKSAAHFLSQPASQPASPTGRALLTGLCRGNGAIVTMAGSRLIAHLCLLGGFLALWLVAFLQGQVLRTPLPIDEINSISGDASAVPLPPVRLKVVVLSGDAPEEENSECTKWMQQLTSAAQIEKAYSSIMSAKYGIPGPHVVERVILESGGEEGQALHGMLNSEEIGEMLAEQASPGTTPEYLLYIDCPPVEGGAETMGLTIGRTRNALLRLDLSARKENMSTVAQMAAEALSDMVDPPIVVSGTHVQVGLKYTLTFTLLSEDPSQLRCTWDFSDLSNTFLGKAMGKLSPLADFEIESQEVSFARMAHFPPAVELDPTPHHYYTVDDLRGFLSANDHGIFALRPGIDLQFMLFCPSPDRSPLLFRDRNGQESTAFEVPGFGGVAVLNIDRASNASEGPPVLHTVTAQEARVAFGSYLMQLRRILGLEKVVTAPMEHELPLSGVRVRRLPSRADGFATWEIDSLLRVWLQRHWRKAIKSLSSISRLVVELPQMEVGLQVASDVSGAVDALRESSILNRESERMSTETSFLQARRALTLSERAYEDPSMVPMLWFPQEHLLAVYAPLIAPLVLPFAIGVMKEYRRFKEKQLARRVTTS
jgi:hypothetical protein